MDETITVKNQLIGQKLHANREFLAPLTVDTLLAKHGSIFQEYHLTRDFLLESIHTDISRLFVAIITNRPVLFSQYIEWQKSLVEKNAIPIILYEHELEALQSSLFSFFASEHHDFIRQFIQAGIDVIHKKIDTSRPLNGLGQNANHYLKLLLKKDTDGAFHYILNEMTAKYSIQEIYLEIIQPAQYEVGRLWQINEIRVAQEHFATKVSSTIMDLLLQQHSRQPGFDEKIVTTCVGGEFHEMGIKFVNAFLEMEGYKPIYTGRAKNNSEITQVIKAEQPQIVAISATMSSHLIIVKKLIEQIRKIEMPPMKIIVGGHVFNQSPWLWQEIQADAYAPNAGQAIKIIKTLLLPQSRP